MKIKLRTWAQYKHDRQQKRRTWHQVFLLLPRRISEDTLLWGRAWRKWGPTGEYRVGRHVMEYEYLDFNEGVALRIKGELK